MNEKLTIARVLRLPEFPGDFVIFTVQNLHAAAANAFPAFGLRADGTRVLGPKFSIDLAVNREGPARSAARILANALANAERKQFTISGRRTLTIDRPLVMAAINTTPDSFSDGGDLLDPAQAADAAVEATRAGAAIVDIGGESTRPGSAPVAAGEEIARVVPAIIQILQKEPNCYISVDTTKSEVARASVEAGASMINDISGLQFDPSLGETAASLGVPIVLGHTRGTPAEMQTLAKYGDAVAEVFDELTEAIERARRAGIAHDRILIDPGLGFAKLAIHNWEILRRLFEFRSLGFPIVIGPSRKSFLGELLGGRPPKDRDAATIATIVLAARAGASICRVHNAAPACDALRVLGFM
ncbi:MAG: dihydropteroate synthase [Planctomycetota bacterium]